MAGAFLAKATDCTGNGRKWQHGVHCCQLCHQVRTDANSTAKTAVLLADKIVHSVSLLGKPRLDKSDIGYLQHAILDRPTTSGNEAFTRLKDAVKIHPSCLLIYVRHVHALHKPLHGLLELGYLLRRVAQYSQTPLHA